jgi:hypothetical protein
MGTSGLIICFKVFGQSQCEDHSVRRLIARLYISSCVPSCLWKSNFLICATDCVAYRMPFPKLAKKVLVNMLLCLQSWFGFYADLFACRWLLRRGEMFFFGEFLDLLLDYLLLQHYSSCQNCLLRVLSKTCYI